MRGASFVQRHLLSRARRLVRDQAHKTLDLYVQRIRKYADTLPDTALPPAAAAAAGSLGAAAPRIGTPQHDTSWAGWAISSFTNKLASATGEIQATSQPRPASATPLTTTSTSTSKAANSAGLASAGSLSASPPARPSATLRREASAPRPGVACAAPGAFDDDDDFGADAWGELDDDHASSAAATPAPLSAPATSFDAGGEPDFAAWLTAQSQSKQVGKKPAAQGAQEGGASERRAARVGTRTIAAAKSAPAPASAAPKPRATARVEQAAEEEDDTWGEAW